MESWIIPCNLKQYDVVGAFNNLPMIDWKQSATSINVGDIVYIYVSTPIKAIKYKCVVRKTLMDKIEINDTPYIIDGSNYVYSKYHMKLELLETYGEELTLDKLREQGIKGNIQGPQRVNELLLKYMLTLEE